MAILEHLEPRGVFRFFEELCAIPHGSSNTKAVSDWLMDFARERGLEAYQDGLNNVIIIKEATSGYESAEPVILQGHMDMVCEKAPGCAKDMEKEGLDLAVDGDAVYAEGTTLGGDDGIAVAMALAILDADDIPHPRLEAVFTVDEEIGMLGATALDVSMLRGRRMLNLDSEEEGVFTVGCAGGNLTQCTLPLTRAPYAGKALTVTVGGLRGGHSGAEIDKGLGNANMLMGRLLYAASRKAELRLVEVNGGLKDNAIPRETVATLVTTDPEAVLAVCRELDAQLKNEYRTTDPDVFVTAAESTASLPMDDDTTRRVLCFLTCAPNGIQAMSADMPGLVQTSLNLGILKADAEASRAEYSVRSSVESEKDNLIAKLSALVELTGGDYVVTGDYPGWKYRVHSPLREKMVKLYAEMYGNEPRVEAIHAGLECGILASGMPDLDIVSTGPDILDIHTPQERMSIVSVQRTYTFVLRVLEELSKY